MNRVILVGRHLEYVLPNVEVVGHRNITWSLDYGEAEQQFLELIKEAKENNCKILFQNIPGILGAIIARWYKVYQDVNIQNDWAMEKPNVEFGVVVSVPDFEARQAPKVVDFFGEGLQEIERAIMVANGRAKVTLVTENHLRMEVEAVTPFKFHSVIWF